MKELDNRQEEEMAAINKIGDSKMGKEVDALLKELAEKNQKKVIDEIGESKEEMDKEVERLAARMKELAKENGKEVFAVNKVSERNMHPFANLSEERKKEILAKRKKRDGKYVEKYANLNDDETKLRQSEVSTRASETSDKSTVADSNEDRNSSERGSFKTANDSISENRSKESVEVDFDKISIDEPAEKVRTGSMYLNEDHDVRVKASRSQSMATAAPKEKEIRLGKDKRRASVIVPEHSNVNLERIAKGPEKQQANSEQQTGKQNVEEEGILKKLKAAVRYVKSLFEGIFTGKKPVYNTIQAGQQPSQQYNNQHYGQEQNQQQKSQGRSADQNVAIHTNDPNVYIVDQKSAYASAMSNDMNNLLNTVSDISKNAENSVKQISSRQGGNVYFSNYKNCCVKQKVLAYET